jgi:hypothetical protein
VQDIKYFIESGGILGDCNYCESKDVHICDVNDVGKFIMEGVERYYEEAANQVMFNSSEGGYQLETLDMIDILIDQEAIFGEILCDPYILLNDLVSNEGTPYVRKDPYGPPSGDPEEIRYWENFCNIVKNHQRFTIFMSLSENDSYDYNKPKNFLFHLIEDFMPSLISILQPTTKVFRARIKEGNQNYGHKKLTSPPAEFSKNNRMNPAGISFFYGGMEPETCIQEVRPYVGEKVVVGKFEVIQALFVLDLTKEIESRKSIFDPEYVFSYEEYFKPFLAHFANDISKPIRKTDKEIEYVPTQVFSEFLKTVNFKDHYLYLDEKGEKSDVLLNGILYKSSKGVGKNLVLFRGQDISTSSRKSQNNHWLLFKGKKTYQINRVEVISTLLKTQSPRL